MSKYDIAVLIGPGPEWAAEGVEGTVAVSVGEVVEGGSSGAPEEEAGETGLVGVVREDEEGEGAGEVVWNGVMVELLLIGIH